MKGGSCFSGVGGLDKGLEEAGVEVAWQIEIDAFRRKVLEKHWPGTPRYDDITNVTGDELEDVDVLFGGFPCQDLSTAGKRKGLAGERSSLFFEFARLAGVLLPRWLLIENVPGLLSSHEGRDMGIVIETLSELGYGVGWRVLDSQYFGVPQRRRRVYIVGHLGAPCPPAVLFESKGSRGDPPPSGKAGEGVASALAASVRGTGDGHGNAWNSTYIPEVAHAQLKGRNGRFDPNGETFVVRTDNTGSNGWGVEERETTYGVITGQVVAQAFSENQRGEVVLSDYAHQLTKGGGKPGQGYPAIIHPPLTTQGRTPDVGDGSDVHRRVVIANSLRECDGHHGRSSPRRDGGDNLVVGQDISHSLGASGRGVDEPTGTTYLVEGNGVCPEAHTNGVGAVAGVPRPLDVSLSCECKDAARYSACGDAVTVNVARWLGIRLTVVDELMYGG